MLVSEATKTNPKDVTTVSVTAQSSTCVTRSGWGRQDPMFCDTISTLKATIGSPKNC